MGTDKTYLCHGPAGMAQALGVRFYDQQHHRLPQGGGALAELATIDLTGCDQRLKTVKVIIASDVTNPLIGPQGASAVFGAQKGATSHEREQLDQALSHYAEVIAATLGCALATTPGAGAGGGLAAGLMAFCHAECQSGIELVMAETHLEEQIAQADVVFTGEGQIDGQTRYGKTPQGVARLAKKYGKPVIALAGSIGAGAEALYQDGISAIFGIIPQASDLSALLHEGAHNITRTSENIMRLLEIRDEVWCRGPKYSRMNKGNNKNEA